jgi:hypothetical protein
MIRLKNIVRSSADISCDFYPEDSVVAGNMSVNMETGNVEYLLPAGYEWCMNHVHHAKKKLLEIAGSNKEYPKELIIKWY